MPAPAAEAAGPNSRGSANASAGRVQDGTLVDAATEAASLPATGEHRRGVFVPQSFGTRPSGEVMFLSALQCRGASQAEVRTASVIYCFT